MRRTRTHEKRVEVFLKGGLGNQLFQYAAARGLASHLGADRITLNLSFYRKPLQVLQSVSVRKFELLPFIDNPITQIKTGSYFQAFRQRTRKSGFSSTGSTSFKEKNASYQDRFWKSQAPIYLEGYFHSLRYFENVSEELRNEFSGASSRVSTISQSVRTIANSRALGVHVRRGDYLANSTYNILGPDYYQRTIQTAVNDIAPTAIYFFSDDSKWLKKQDFSRMGSVISNKNLSDVEEFLLLASCDHFVIANSSFSWWAAWLGNDPGKRVYAPKEWFATSDTRPENYFPSSWTVIPNT